MNKYATPDQVARAQRRVETVQSKLKSLEITIATVNKYGDLAPDLRLLHAQLTVKLGIVAFKHQRCLERLKP